MSAIQRVEIDGRSGSAMFVDDGFQPVDAAVATLLKVVFDDGGQLILKAKPEPDSAAKRWAKVRARALALLKGTGTWDEAEHPRGEGGRFTDAGGGGSGGGAVPPPEAATVAAPAPAAAETSKGKVEDIKEFAKAGVELGRDVLFDPGLAKQFLATWNTKINQTPGEFHKSFLGGLQGTMQIDYSMHDEKFSISGLLQKDNAGKYGNYTMYMDFKKNRAEAGYLKLAKSDEGKSIGKVLMSANVDMYEKYGLDAVDIHANIDVGGYAWAKFGYVPNRDSWNRLSSSLEYKVDQMGGGGGGYTAESWDQITDHDQAQIEDAWTRDTHQEFLDGEIENWRESGQALEQAKSDLAGMFDSLGGVPEWAGDALDKLRDSRDEAGKPSIPYTNVQLAEAIGITYSSRKGDGREDPEITFDDARLQEPSNLPPKEQGTLPGIEPIDPASRLTEDMRDDITHSLTRAFNLKAESDAEDIEPPDYLNDSVAEFQSEYWSSMSDREKFRWAEANGKLPEVEAPTDEPIVDASSADTLRKLLLSDDPKALWAIADAPGGKELMLDSSWFGKLDLRDKESMTRFRAYVGKALGSATSKLAAEGYMA